MIQNKTEVLNLKSRKTQLPIGYLTQKFKSLNVMHIKRKIS